MPLHFFGDRLIQPNHCARSELRHKLAQLSRVRAAANHVLGSRVVVKEMRSELVAVIERQ